MRLVYLLLAGLFPVCLFAQNEAPRTLIEEEKIYFSSNSASVGAASLQLLEKFVQQHRKTANSEIELQAFTDDVGDQQANEKLAQQRAMAVQKALEELGVDKASICQLASKELQPDPKKDIAQQRRNFRRVDLRLMQDQTTSVAKVVNESPQLAGNQTAIQAFFASERQKAQQRFTLSCDKRNTVKGEKGTVLQIPTQAFTYPDGTPVKGKVEFVLQEAYTNGDLILQNLPTMAGDRILETGGSIYIEARDEQGTKLELAADKEITASMAGEAARGERMRTFNGVEDSAGNVNWQATNLSVLRFSNKKYDYIKSEGRQSYSQSKIYEKAEKLKFIPFQELDELPREVEQPRFRLRKPKKPNYYQIKKTSYKSIRSKYPRNSNESYKKYGRRIRNMYQKKLKTYLRLKKINRKRFIQYRRDSSKYAKTYSRYQSDSLAYDVYCNKMRTIAYYLKDQLTKFSYSEYNNSWNYILAAYNDFNKKKYLQHRVHSDISILLKEFKNYEEFDPLRSAFEKVDISNLWNEKDSRKAIYAWLRDQHENIDNRVRKAIRYRDRFGNVKVRHAWNIDRFLRSNKNTISNVCNKIPQQGELRSYHLHQIQKVYKNIQDKCKFKVMERPLNDLDNKLQENAQSIEHYFNTENQLHELYNACIDLKGELGLLTSEEVASNYRNALKIDRMGWINCDRFYENNKPKVDMEILVQQPKNTTIYVVFENINSVMPAYPSTNGKFVVRNIPAGEQVKIIGLQIEDQKANVFLTHLKTKKTQIPSKFEEMDLKEARALIASS